MTEDLIELAKRIESQPWNRPGTDKTWVLNVTSSYRKFQKEVSQSKRVERGGSSDLSSQPKTIELLQGPPARREEN
jgi:hypothetical protein